ncbi:MULTISPECIES: hypothetical protein [Mesorhizobium]|uniref:hypothetical protein n=2 Tax=Phyllobacteriaceae TaxID=69277 RepID=UPI000FCB9A86|nr:MULTISPECIES: hypothetical protein [Mesorhizobium]MDX8436727.1 hypothetical protein [Mesorhizobium abyssinicae]RUW67291.1 hypothetical protein EOA31_29075 [Mesorhizobium sp. M4B.F.Ca.ET.049.02.1.2]RWC97052.1 MAG: hypothetical protein EOS32_06115 [Mesorhizobium sp.]TGV26378.1 hypothetical protein EN786_12730 [Mesorhizobium sp. M4B.F.Ca.ET.143.01.1.1]TIW74403.1 MAG: hypothetical protein E5V58_06370 [Mesorhizobium sp.]
MYFPQFLVGMLATSFITAIWAEIETGSVWKALGWAILALVILQVGYIGLVVGLIYKRGSKGTEAAQMSANYTPPA